MTASTDLKTLFISYICACLYGTASCTDLLSSWMQWGRFTLASWDLHWTGSVEPFKSFLMLLGGWRVEILKTFASSCSGKYCSDLLWSSRQQHQHQKMAKRIKKKKRKNGAYQVCYDVMVTFDMFPHTNSLDRDTKRDRTLFLCCLPTLHAFRQTRGHVGSTVNLPGIGLIDKRT